MLDAVVLTTPRLRLRPWREEDKEPFAQMNADPRVMEFFPSVWDREASDAMVERIGQHFAEHGWGFWAVERLADGAFLGFTGMRYELGLPFSPCFELGWRIAHPYWGQGYASEAARACIAFGFDELGVDEIVAVTALPNLRSQAVMQRIGMRDTGQVFDHPRVEEGNWLRAHCLYRIRKSVFA
jgi:RimJ/RimL family protein N-acetyltransferase